MPLKARVIEQWTPQADRVLLRQLKDPGAERYGSLVLPPSAEEWQRYRRWVVAAVGADVQDETLLPGVEVIVTKFSTSPIEHRGETLAFVNESNVIAVIP